MDRPWSAARRALRAAALALAAALAGVPPAPAGAERPCRTIAARHLNRLGIDPGDVTDIAMIAIITNPEFGSVIEYQAWTSFRSCAGNLIVKLTPWCRVKEAYTRGRCRFDGISRF